MFLRAKINEGDKWNKAFSKGLEAISQRRIFISLVSDDKLDCGWQRLVVYRSPEKGAASKGQVIGNFL